MPESSGNQTTPKSLGSRVLYWVLSLAVLVIVGTVFVLMLGGVQGSEIDPMRFASRTFYYYRIPFTQLQISPTWYDSSSGRFENEIAPYLPARQSRKRHWQVAKVQYGAISDYGDPKIMDDLFWIIDDHARVDSEFWTSWSKNNQEIAKLFWPIVSEIGVNDAYLILPEFVEATRRVSSAEEFKRDVMPQLVVLYNALAEDFDEAEDFARVKTLANLALGHDPQNAESLRLQTEAARQLEKANLGDNDLATSRELE